MKLQTKNTKKIVSFALTICIIFSMLAAALPLATAATMDVNYLTLAPGSDATQLNFSWHTSVQVNNPVVRIWKQDNIAIDFTGTGSNSVSSLSTMYYNRVTVTGLEANTVYTYQLGDGNGNWSVEYTTKTGSSTSFSYLVFGDPQVSSQVYGNNWKNTLELALGVNPDLVFMASTGDNIDSSTKVQYDYFFTPQSIFSSLPLASCMGNHEGSSSNNYVFYNSPNADAQTQNYWYRYGDTLFMVWNTNYGNANTMRAFLKSAIDANLDATWRILNFHYDVYGQGDSHALSDGKTYRDTYVPVIDEFNIDVVFNGHDHFYSRSYPMKWSGSSSTSNNQGMQPETFGPNGESIDPTGTVYFSLSSSSGQKYYGAAAKQAYTAFMPTSQSNRPHFSIVDMTANSFTCTTYEVKADNTLTAVDSYTIVKTMPAVVSLSGVTDIVVGNDATYTVSVGGVSKLATVTLQFEVDSTYFSGTSFTGLNGFGVLGDVTWTQANGVWTGRVTLVNLNGGVNSADAFDIFEMVFSSNSNSLGTTDVKLVDAILSGYNGDDVAVYIDSLVTNGLVQTVIGQYFSKYDVNRDGVVDQLDLTTAQLFFMAQEGDANWNAAKIVDVNNDGVVDVEDLILILKNIIW
jgi:hypothetical protein